MHALDNYTTLWQNWKTTFPLIKPFLYALLCYNTTLVKHFEKLYSVNVAALQKKGIISNNNFKSKKDSRLRRAAGAIG